MPIHIELRPNESAPVVYIIRTARRLFEGKVFVETPDQ
jgi:2-methylaconitate cis-trans-isomerase PrpF